MIPGLPRAAQADDLTVPRAPRTVGASAADWSSRFPPREAPARWPSENNNASTETATAKTSPSQCDVAPRTPHPSSNTHTRADSTPRRGGPEDHPTPPPDTPATAGPDPRRTPRSTLPHPGPRHPRPGGHHIRPPHLTQRPQIQLILRQRPHRLPALDREPVLHLPMRQHVDHRIGELGDDPDETGRRPVEHAIADRRSQETPPQGSFSTFWLQNLERAGKEPSRTPPPHCRTLPQVNTLHKVTPRAPHPSSKTCSSSQSPHCRPRSSSNGSPPADGPRRRERSSERSARRPSGERRQRTVHAPHCRPPTRRRTVAGGRDTGPSPNATATVRRRRRSALPWPKRSPSTTTA